MQRYSESRGGSKVQIEKRRCWISGFQELPKVVITEFGDPPRGLKFRNESPYYDGFENSQARSSDGPPVRPIKFNPHLVPSSIHNGKRYRRNVSSLLSYLTISALYNPNGAAAIIAFVIFFGVAIGLWYRESSRQFQTSLTIQAPLKIAQMPNTCV